MTKTKAQCLTPKQQKVLAKVLDQEPLGSSSFRGAFAATPEASGRIILPLLVFLCPHEDHTAAVKGFL